MSLRTPTSSSRSPQCPSDMSAPDRIVACHSAHPHPHLVHLNALQICLLLIVSLRVTPHTHILISFTSIRFSCNVILLFILSVLSCQRRRGRIASASTRPMSAVNPCLGVSCGATEEPVVSGSSCVCRIDPCSALTCRVQFVAVRVGSSCECRYGQGVGGDVRAGFVDVLGREDSFDETSVTEGGVNLGNPGEGGLSLPDEEPEPEPTTTARPPTRPGRSRGRSRGRVVRPGDMIPV